MSGSLSVLARIRTERPEPSAYGRCDLCAAPVSQEHGHVVDVGTRALRCACRPCYLLFAHDDVALTHRAVPDRYLALPALPTPLRDRLDLPVGTAFLFRNSALDRVVALYPGPAGATESELPLAAWTDLVAAVPELGTLRPDVEALLLHSEAGRSEAYVVPIDTCYELVGHLRLLWRGFDGGQDVRRRVEELFDDVRARSTRP